MKKFLKTFISKMKSAVVSLRTRLSIILTPKSNTGNAVQMKLAENNGQIFMEHTVGFIAVIVLGGIAIALLTALLRNDMAPALTTKIMDLFN